VAPGDAVPIAVSLSAPGSFSWSVFRLGWYGGALAREVARGSPEPGGRQPPCPAEPATGLIACRWTASFLVETSPTWLSGAYLVKLVRSDGFERYVPFVVRPGRRAELVMIVPTATWAAYNDWGGASLYSDSTGVSARRRAYRVSFDRPFARDAGAGHLLSEDQSVITWLEAQGYDVAYATVEDADRDPFILDGAKALVVSAHDEYWTARYRTRADAALARGSSIVNLGANNGYWQVRLEDAADGRPRRIVTCYKADAPLLDPAGPESPELTVKFRDAPVSRPEDALFGIMFNGSWNTWALPAVVTRPDHWLFARTGLAALDILPMVHGYEVDEVVGAAPADLEVAAESTTLTLNGGVGRAQMAVRPRGAAWVFSAGGVGFAEGLSEDGKADPRVGRIAANVLAKVLGRPPPEPLVEFGAPPVVEGAYASAVRTVATGLQAPVAIALLPQGRLAVVDTGEGTVRELGANGASRVLLSGLMRPLGIAAEPDGTIYVSDSGRSCIRQISPAGVASTFAGSCWSVGSVDGVGESARFAAPAGLAIRNRVLYVADVGASTVRAVNLDTAAVTTVPAPGLYRPTAIAFAADSAPIVVESGARRLVALRGGVVEVLAGDRFAAEGYEDGPAASARLMPQLGVATLADGSIVFSDPGSYRVRRVAGGRVTAFAGSGRAGRRDGGGGTADLVLPTGLAVAPDGTIYVADTGNGAVRAITR
jgi:sugar lactone lactonase YvrE